MKKKLLTTSIAATLVFGSFGGLPLNSTAVKWAGAGVAHADALDDSGIAARLKGIYDELLASEREAISKARAELNNQSTAVEGIINQEVWNRISDKITENGGSFPSLTEENVVKLFKAAIFLYDEDLTGLRGAIADPGNRAVLRELASLAGVTTSGNDSADVKAFADAVETELKAKFANLLASHNDIAKVKTILAGVLDSVIADPNLKISKALSNVDLDGSTLFSIFGQVNTLVDPDNEALKAVVAAYGRSQSSIKTAATNDWRVLTPSLEVWGNSILANLFTWEVTGDSNVSYDDGKIVLSSQVTNSYTAKPNIKVSFGSNTLFQKEVELSFTAPSRPAPGGGGGGGGGGSAPAVKAPDQKAAEDKLDEVVSTFDGLFASNAGSALAEARKAIEEAIRTAGTMNASEFVKVESGVAKSSITGSAVDAAFKALGEIAKLAKETLKEQAPGASEPKVVATLDFGKVDATAAELALPKEVIDKAKSYGIDVLAVKINGVTIAIPVSEMAAGLNVGIKSSASNVTGAASEQFELTFKDGDGPVTTFGQPVEVRLPIASTTGKDTELFVFSKVEENGALTLKGGQYNDATKEFIALNKAFSDYVVVENNVSFADTASVKEWAGRQIQVAAAKGILEGRAAGEFVPNDSVTRAEFAKMIVKTFGLEDNSATESFHDVRDYDWFQPYVAAAVKAGIVNGRTDTAFEPNATITRAEMATMASRALSKVLEYKPAGAVEAALKGFADANSIHETLQSGVALAAEQGIVIGEENNKFNPNENSTRAQAAVVIYRLLNK